MGLSLSISTDNDAFADGRQVTETVRILRHAIDCLENYAPTEPLRIVLRDSNGNSVGELAYRPTWHADR